ncbi:hypothetical protein EJ070_31725 [Mesorhizobium sp. M1E.F.Ca.ET.045.02.1.1]|uniref:VapE domain-containing protein n=1 Tax=Mesorhizobium sp. M1E.F.Ca.ET.045.02.1.1 TaxID=2493672 RepID=UPI000F74FC05|nr:VapE domain-containing protein [Mesorhizobium sp. M1E.F.Ca.ET.045.02.1.1]AZO24788.1 hypothetical protein EJ070_31725 [Mesorhizobium sp. M1E.F.Ca.ET.045.02.1.1]
MSVHDISQYVSVDKRYGQASAFTSAISAYNEVINFRFIHDANKSVPAIDHRDTLANAWPSILQYQKHGYGIFVVIAELDSNGRKLENVQSIRAHYADLDNINAEQNLDRANAWTPAPSFAVVSSPRRRHVYWPVQRYAGNDRFQLVQRKLAQFFEGDKAVNDAARVMRLPGTYNTKYSNPQSDKYSGSQPHLVTCFALAGSGITTTVEALEQALAAVNVIEGSGGRHDLGDPGLAGPSLPELAMALDKIDPNTLDRAKWISTTAAFKQAGWTLTDELWLFNTWSAWCTRYAGNDVGENLKQWGSIRNTEVGWPALHRTAYGRPPQPDPAKLFGSNGNTLPAPQPGMPVPQAHDGYVEIISTATGDSGKNTLMETVKVLHGNLPVAFDEFTQTVIATQPLPWDKHSSYPRQWTELDTIHCQLSVQALFVKPGKDTVHDAVAIIANKHKRHQVRDYLNGLAWDRIERLPHLATAYFGAPDSDYARIVGTKFMLGAVARIMSPGSKMDNVVILEGKQGTGKSSAIAMLAGPQWFTDELPDLHTKDAAIQLRGKWIIEVGELSALKRSDVETIKKFMARSTDTYRAPYERTTEDHPRQCVFVATTNDENYLKDQTGNRRFWPLACGTINVDAIRRDRDQLWAEAVARLRAGERWWLEGDETRLAEAAQEDRREIDAWEARIAEHVAVMAGLPTTIENVCAILGIDFERQNSAVTRRIAQCLMRAGYARKRSSGRGRPWHYVPTDIDNTNK